MGQCSYEIAEQKWIKEGRLPGPSTEDSLSLSARVGLRPILWKLAHEKKLPDGSWGIDPSEVKLKEIAQKIDQNLEIEAKAKEDGTFVQDYAMDALSKALGKRDHCGRVKAIGGVHVGLKQVFGRSKRKGPSMKKDNCESHEDAMANKVLEKMRPTIEKEIEERVAAALKDALNNMVGNVDIAKNSPLYPDTPKESVSGAMHSPRDLVGPTPCLLAILEKDTKHLVVVADGTAYPSRVIHNEETMANHYKVSCDNPYPDHIDAQLPCASKDGITTRVGEAKGHFLEWLVHLVVFLDEEERTLRNEAQPRKDASSNKDNETNKSIVGSAASGILMPLDDPDEQEDLIGDDCKTLSLFVHTATEFKSKVINIEPPLFYYTEGRNNSVFSKQDIIEFFKWQCINVSILHVYQLFFMEEYADYFDQSLVSFLCPTKFNEEAARMKPSKTIDYLKDAFLIEKDKKDKQCKFILAPYNFWSHWMLFVMDLQAGEVYVFNSISNDNLKDLKIYPLLKMAFQIYKLSGGRAPKTSRELHFTPIECAQQNGNKECGYYVMKFMDEIVSLYADCDNLKEAYFGTTAPYTKEDLDDVREKWAKFFRIRYISPTQSV